MKKYKKVLANFLYFNKFIKKARAVQFLSPTEMAQSAVKGDSFIGTNGYILSGRKKQEFNNEKIKFLYVGRLDYHIKGLDIMLDAFKLLMESPYKDQCELHIYGPDYQGRYAHVEQMIAERSLEGAVKLNPAVFGVDKETVLLESDVFVQTSRTEAMPMGLLEALAYGLPCLVTVGTTLGNVIKRYNAGWVAEINVQSVYEQMVAAIKEKKFFQEKSNNARMLIAQEFAWEKIAKETVENYKEFI